MKLKTLTILAGATLLLQACASDANIDANTTEAATTSPTTNSATSNVKTHVVQEGENLHIIAKREYGSISDWTKIYDANRDQITDPTLVYPGQKLVLPR